MTHVKACKTKFNAVKAIKKTPKLRAKVNCVVTKGVKFSLYDSAIDEEAIFDEEYKDDKLATCDNDEVKDSKGLEQGSSLAPILEIVEPATCDNNEVKELLFEIGDLMLIEQNCPILLDLGGAICILIAI
jgi:hypothetical protein